MRPSTNFISNENPHRASFNCIDLFNIKSNPDRSNSESLFIFMNTLTSPLLLSSRILPLFCKTISSLLSIPQGMGMYTVSVSSRLIPPSTIHLTILIGKLYPEYAFDIFIVSVTIIGTGFASFIPPPTLNLSCLLLLLLLLLLFVN